MRLKMSAPKSQTGFLGAVFLNAQRLKIAIQPSGRGSESRIIGNQLRQVVHFEAVLFFLRFHAVFHHRQAEWAVHD